MRFGVIISAPYRPLLLVLAAAWPVWVWYVRRTLGGPGDPVEVLALATAVLLFFHHRHRLEVPRPWQLMGVSLMLILYAASFAWVFPMIRAGLILAALGILLARTRASLALTTLLALSLPVSASLQFYLGYPLRVIVAEASRLLLALMGWPVSRIGTALHWAGETILVDAPCSGLKMLWAGCFFAAGLAYWRRLSAPKAILLQGISVGVLIAANIVRATALFFKESGMVALPGWTHEATGLLVFASAALILFALSRKFTPSPETL